MADRIPMTAKGKIQLAEELVRLKSVDRPRIVKEIETARAHGDLSENAEYHAAKDKQGQLEGRIRYLEDQIGRAEVIDMSKLTDERVVFGVYVKLVDVEGDKEFSYQIVGEVESDIAQGKISITSPIAKALIGREVGDSVVVQTPGGRRELEVVEISLG